MELDLRQLIVLTGDALGIGSLVDFGAYTQSCSGGRGADEADDRGQTYQRFASPIHGDMRKQSMLELVPLAGAWRIVADSDRQARAIGKALQLQFPQAHKRVLAPLLPPASAVLSKWVAPPYADRPMRFHQLRMALTAKLAVSWSMPTLTQPSSRLRS